MLIFINTVTDEILGYSPLWRPLLSVPKAGGLGRTVAVTVEVSLASSSRLVLNLATRVMEVGRRV